MPLSAALLTCGDDDRSMSVENRSESRMCITIEATVTSPHHATRTVRFSEECTVIEYIKPASELTEYEKRDIYYDAQDYQRFRSSARTFAKTMHSSSEPHNRTSYGSILIQTYLECTRWKCNGPDETVRRYLEHWVTVGATRRGLERWGVKGLGSRISQRKDEAITSVLRIQQLVRQQREMNQQGRAEFIRLAYEQITRPARLFGEAIGGADALAAQDNEVVRRISILRQQESDPAIDMDAAFSPSKKLREQVQGIVTYKVSSATIVPSLF